MKFILRFSILLIIGFYSCKKESVNELGTKVGWNSPAINDTFLLGSTVSINGLVHNLSSFQHIEFNLIKNTEKQVVEIGKVDGNNTSLPFNYEIEIDSSFNSAKNSIEIKVEANGRTNTFKRSFYVVAGSKKEGNILIVTKSTFGNTKFSLLNGNLSETVKESSLSYEFDKGKSWNGSYYFSTKGKGGFIELNSSLSEKILLVNNNNQSDFIQAIGRGTSNIYCSTSLSNNQIIGFNTQGNETVRIGLQLDRCEDIVEIDDCVFSIEKANTDNKYVIHNYNKRVGGYISNQQVNQLLNSPKGFHFGNANQFYFIANKDGKGVISRLAKTENNISEIKEFGSSYSAADPQQINSNEVLILFKDRIYVFNKYHETRGYANPLANAIGIRYNKATNQLIVFNSTTVKLYNFPSFELIAKRLNEGNIKDVQFLD